MPIRGADSIVSDGGVGDGLVLLEADTDPPPPHPIVMVVASRVPTIAKICLTFIFISLVTFNLNLVAVFPSMRRLASHRSRFEIKIPKRGIPHKCRQLWIAGQTTAR